MTSTPELLHTFRQIRVAIGFFSVAERNLFEVVQRLIGATFKGAERMNKTILVGLAILTVSTSAASAMTHRTHHRRAMNPNAAAATMNPNSYTGPRRAYGAMGAPQAAMPAMTGKNQEMYMKNLHDSGYNPKDDFTKAGTMAQH